MRLSEFFRFYLIYALIFYNNIIGNPIEVLIDIIGYCINWDGIIGFGRVIFYNNVIGVPI